MNDMAGKRIEPHMGGATTPAAKKAQAKSASRPAPRGSNRRAKPASTRAKARKSPSKASQRSRPVRIVTRTLYWSTVVGLWAVLAVGALFTYHAAQLPSSDTWSVPQRAPDIRILDRAGRLVAHRGIGSRELSLDEMSPFLPQAVIAIEDHRFRSHVGFDPIGFSRAMARNLAAGRLRQGGSTLTQQLAKNLFLSRERTFGRKIQELVLAFWLERRFSKDQILELYLNRVYFGHGATGVDAAARKYFGTSARRLNLRQAAMLAGALKAPSRINPITSMARAKRRSDLVLAAMEREGFITAGQRAQPGLTAPRTAIAGNRSHAWAADMAAREVKALLGRIDRDLDVHVTLDRDVQHAAHRAVRTALDRRGGKLGVEEGALVALAPDGAIRALVGGRDYDRSAFDRASVALRQPGSAFKPFLWAAALERGASPLDTIADTPLATGRYRPRNASDRYRGEVTLAEALAVSSNTAAVRLARDVGPRALARRAKTMGIGSHLIANEALALGTSEVTPLELTEAYAAFANGGRRARAYLVTRIAEPDGRVLYERAPVRGERVLDERIAGEMHALLAGVVRDGTGRRAALDTHVAVGKTGTTQGGRDAWFSGFAGRDAQRLVATVWFGNDDASPSKASGGSLAAGAWGDFMRRVLEPRTVAAPRYALFGGEVTVPTARPYHEPKEDGALPPQKRPGWLERLLGR